MFSEPPIPLRHQLRQITQIILNAKATFLMPTKIPPSKGNTVLLRKYDFSNELIQQTLEIFTINYWRDEAN